MKPAKAKVARSRKSGTKKSAGTKTGARRKEQKLSSAEPMTTWQAPDNSIESEDVFIPPENPLDPIPEEILAKFRKIRFQDPVGKPDRVARAIIEAMHEYFDEEEARSNAREPKTFKKTRKASVTNKTLSAARKSPSSKKSGARKDVSS